MEVLRKTWEYSNFLQREMAGTYDKNGQLGKMLILGDCVSVESSNSDDVDFHTHVDLDVNVNFYPPGGNDITQLVYKNIKLSKFCESLVLSSEGVYSYSVRNTLMQEIFDILHNSNTTAVIVNKWKENLIQKIQEIVEMSSANVQSFLTYKKYLYNVGVNVDFYSYSSSYLT